jgi:dienelactone hydrolase
MPSDPELTASTALPVRGESSRRRAKRRLACFALILFAAGVLIWQPGARLVRAGQLLLALSSTPSSGEQRSSEALIEEDLTIPSSTGSIRARSYRRADRPRGKGLIVAHGVHFKGIDEPRLIPFARELARTGLVVVTPELTDLTDYRITAQGAAVIGDTARWLAARHDKVEEPRVGVLGFSFAGGLALVAASEPEVRERLSYVVSVGGHHDLERVLRFLVSDRIETPKGVVQATAHEYGLVVLLYGNLERVIPEPDRDVVRGALKAWLQEDKSRALALFTGCVTDECEKLAVLLADQRLKELAPMVNALIDERRSELALLSPHGHLQNLDIPVYLLHGSADSVIPPSELEWASEELGPAEHAALVSPLLEHVEVSKTASVGHQLALLGFMARML